MTMFKPLVLGVVVSAVVTGAALGSAAKNPATGTPAAAPAPGKSAPALSEVRASRPRPPKGYVVVRSGPLNANAGTQTRGTVACPAGTVPFGGGAFAGSTALTVNINSSIPVGNSWLADINNGSGSATTFNVYAVCAKAPKLYQLVSGAAVTNPVNDQSSASVVCPAKTVVLGGGSLSSSGSTAVNINTSIPQSNGWRTDENNASASAATVIPYAVCAKKPKGYVQMFGTDVLNPPGTHTGATVVCPSPTVPLSGGGFSSSSTIFVDLSSSAPSGLSWFVYENNGGAGAPSITADAICAGK
jgi:hypothetical protein